MIQPQLNDSELKQLVNEGWRLHLKIKQLKSRFDQVKTVLRREAGLHGPEHVALDAKGSGGRQWIVGGASSECRVVFPDDKLIGSIDPGSPDFTGVLHAAGDQFDHLFKTVSLIAPRDKDSFREAVRQVLPAKQAKRLLELCTSQAEPRVGWKAKAKTRKPALVSA